MMHGLTNLKICTVSQIKLRWLPSTSFPIHCLLVILPFNVIWCKQQEALLKISTINKFFVFYPVFLQLILCLVLIVRLIVLLHI
jgi:hypothetical protein